MADETQGFGVTARSTAESRRLDPTGITCFRQADIGEYLREVCFLILNHVVSAADVRSGGYALHHLKKVVSCSSAASASRSMDVYLGNDERVEDMDDSKIPLLLHNQDGEPNFGRLRLIQLFLVSLKGFF